MLNSLGTSGQAFNATGAFGSQATDIHQQLRRQIHAGKYALPYGFLPPKFAKNRMGRDFRELGSSAGGGPVRVREAADGADLERQC
jgi:hypothetical protein